MSTQQRPQIARKAPKAQRRLGIAISLLATLIGCAGEPVATIPTEPSGTSTAPTAQSSSTTSVPASTLTSVPDTTTTTESPDAEEGAIEAWDKFWAAWAEVRRSEDLDPGPLEAVADDAVIEGVIALFERQRQTSGPVDTEVITHPKVTIEGDSQAVLEDCVLLRPTFAERIGIWYEADLADGDDGWRVTGLAIRSLQGCVPAEIETAAISAYEAYYEAEGEFWDPPDPDHPLLAETLVEPQLGHIVEVLREHERRGVAFRSDPITHPEVVEVRSPSELVILDCTEPSLTDGVYDLDSGERLPDEPPVQEGQRDLRSAVMVFSDGKWKVSDFQGQVDYECDFAPTEQGLPSV